MANGTTVTESNAAPSEVTDMSVAAEDTPQPPPAFPPYPPYATKPAPPSLADAITAGRDLRLKHKSTPKKDMRPPPIPAKPRGPKATDVKTPKKQSRAYSRCLRKHGAVLTDRLEQMAKPRRRDIINLWREHAYSLPPEGIARLRCMLDADEPFKPDQAYEYFSNVHRSKKVFQSVAKARVKDLQKDILAISDTKRFMWARNATVAFAKGIHQRLLRPGRYALADEMLNLSNVILEEIRGYMHMKPPSRRSMNPKARFIMDISDKVAVWIDDILAESNDRMLMMDFDEDEEVEKSHADALKPPISENANPAIDSGTATPTSTATTTKSEPPIRIKTEVPGETPAPTRAGSTQDVTNAKNVGGATAPLASSTTVATPKPSNPNLPKK